MPLFPQILITNQRSVTDNGIVYTDGDVYITISDETGNVANGNNMLVTVAYNDTGNVNESSYTIPGQNLKIYSGILSRRLINETAPFDYRNFAVAYYTEGPAEPENRGICDAMISSVSILQKETAPGASNAQVKVNASSGYGPLRYQIDEGNVQSSPMFSGIAGGNHTAFITDANNCQASFVFNVPTLKNLLVADPSVEYGNGNTSRWNAAFNPVVFCYQRKDLEVTGIAKDPGSQRPLITVNGVVNRAQPGDLVYLNAGTYTGNYAIYQVSDNYLIIDTTYVLPTTQTGFVNINSLRPYYKILTKISYTDILTGQLQTITAANRPDSSGSIKADFSSFLQSLLCPEDRSDYTALNYRDNNLAASYQVAYAESWDDGTDKGYVSDYIEIPYNYFVVYAAKQLGQPSGGNLASYVPFASVPDKKQLAQWLCDFEEPAYSSGYPFDMAYIYSEQMEGLMPYYELVPLDINKNPLAIDLNTISLLNEDGNRLLKEDSGKFILGGLLPGDRSLKSRAGLHRLLINVRFPAEVAFCSLQLLYTDRSGNSQSLTQNKIIRIENAIDQNSVYLRWIGLSGSWNYYRFGYNQEISLDVQNASIIKNHVSDWETQEGIEEVIAKNAGQKIKVYAEDLSLNDIKGLQSIKYSPKVQMLVKHNPVKWQTVVINTATYSEYETINGNAPFSITFNLPSINIQSR